MITRITIYSMKEGDTIINILRFTDLDIDEAKWLEFWNLGSISFESKKEFLAMIVNNGLDEMLYNNPELKIHFGQQT